MVNVIKVKVTNSNCKICSVSLCSLRFVGAQPKVTDRQKRLIDRMGMSGKASSSSIQRDLNLPVTTRRIRQFLQNNDKLVWTKRKSKPKLTPKHKQSRLNFAREHMSWTTEWAFVIFSDEKKFNLDGPDGAQYYWHHLEKDPEVCWSRNFGGGSLMTWLGFCASGKLEINFISCRCKSSDYILLLRRNLLGEGRSLLGENMKFQQDNASIHCSKETMHWMQQNNIDVIPWPSLSPDLNPVENVWSWIVKRVYHNGTQYANINSLKSAVINAWEECPQTYLDSLINSMPKRIFDVISNKGDKIKY